MEKNDIGKAGAGSHCKYGELNLPPASALFDMNSKDLADVIKGIRKQQELSQGKVAEISGISLRTYQRLENGENVTTDVLLEVLRALNVKISFEIRKKDVP